MIPNKIVYIPRWEGVSFLSPALVHLGYALVTILALDRNETHSHRGLYTILFGIITFLANIQLI
jgi:hypothetical protein